MRLRHAPKTSAAFFGRCNSRGLRRDPVLIREPCGVGGVGGFLCGDAGLLGGEGGVSGWQ